MNVAQLSTAEPHAAKGAKDRDGARGAVRAVAAAGSAGSFVQKSPTSHDEDIAHGPKVLFKKGLGETGAHG